MAFEELKSLLRDQQNEYWGDAITSELIATKIPDVSVDLSTFITNELGFLVDDLKAIFLMDILKLGHVEVEPFAVVLLGTSKYPMAQVWAAGILTILGDVPAYNQLKIYSSLKKNRSDAADVYEEIKEHISAEWKAELYSLF